MKHLRTRYTLEKLQTASDLDRDHGLIYAVVDHQTGQYRAKGLTWNSAHNLIDRLTGADTSEPSAFDFDNIEPAPGAHTRAMARSGAFG